MLVSASLPFRSGLYIDCQQLIGTRAKAESKLPIRKSDARRGNRSGCVDMRSQNMNRKPVYFGAKKRITSCPNGLWQAQIHSGKQATREYDPWVALGPPTDYEMAMSRMHLSEN
jgi:hypothetical protein